MTALSLFPFTGHRYIHVNVHNIRLLQVWIKFCIFMEARTHLLIKYVTHVTLAINEHLFRTKMFANKLNF